MNSRTSFSTISRLALNSRLIVSTMSGLCGSTLKKFQNPRPNRIQVEHLSLMDIEHDRAILAVCASNSIRDSVQGLPHNYGSLFESREAHLATCSGGNATHL